MRQLAGKTSCEFGTFFETGYKEDQIDWQAVKRRIMAAADQRNVSMRDVDALVGLDKNAPDYYDKYHKLPKLKTAVIVSAFLGVPASWVLSGKGDGPLVNIDRNVHQSVSDTKDSTVVQGNTAGTIVINGNEPLSGQKKELMRIFDALSIRNQTRLLNFAYEVEDMDRAN